MSLPRDSFGGPASFPQKNCAGDNSVTKVTMGMPQKFGSANGNMSFALGRNTYINAPFCYGYIRGPNNSSIRVDTNDNQCGNQITNPKWSYSSVRTGQGAKTRVTIQNGKKNEVTSSDQYIQRLKNKAIGRGSTNKSAIPFSFSENNNTNIQNNLNARRRCRSGGCVAPAKKGALANPFKSGGNCC